MGVYQFDTVPFQVELDGNPDNWVEKEWQTASELTELFFPIQAAKDVLRFLQPTEGVLPLPPELELAEDDIVGERLVELERTCAITSGRWLAREQCHLSPVVDGILSYAVRLPDYHAEDANTTLDEIFEHMFGTIPEGDLYESDYAFARITPNAVPNSHGFVEATILLPFAEDRLSNDRLFDFDSRWLKLNQAINDGSVAITARAGAIPYLSPET